MELIPVDPDQNVLPCDGIANYHGPILDLADAWRCHDALLNQVPWRNDEVIIFGKRIVTARKVAWFADAERPYTYSGTTKQAIPWPSELLALKTIVEQRTHAVYNSCLANLYHSGDEGMAWHSDDESALLRHGPIASVSLGAERKFSFKHKRHPLRTDITLQHGSLLVMRGETQTHWLHSLPKTKRVSTPRINLTFRIMRDSSIPR